MVKEHNLDTSKIKTPYLDLKNATIAQMENFLCVERLWKEHFID